MCCDPFTHLIQKECHCSGFMANLTESPADSTAATQEHPMDSKARAMLWSELYLLCSIHPLLQDKWQVCPYALRL